MRYLEHPTTSPGGINLVETSRKGSCVLDAALRSQRSQMTKEQWNETGAADRHPIEISPRIWVTTLKQLHKEAVKVVERKVHICMGPTVRSRELGRRRRTQEEPRGTDSGDVIENNKTSVWDFNPGVNPNPKVHNLNFAMAT